MTSSIGTVRKILIVDDNSASREILISALNIENVEFIEANNGKQALEKIEEHDFDIIISDEVMPRMSGIDLIGECVKLGLKCPFILTTGLSALELKIPKDLEPKITIFEKPFEPENLAQKIEELSEASN